METREIIGYKLKKECKQYKDAALQISNTIGNWENSLATYDISIFQKNYINRLTEAGILELWFIPVYKEEEFKIGDIVVMLKDYSFPILKDKIFKLLKPQGEISEIYWVVNHDGKNSYLAPNKNSFRKASSEEIKTYENNLLLEEAKKCRPQIIINGYTGEFFDKYVKFGCAEIDKELFIDLNKIVNINYAIHGTKNVRSVIIGKGIFFREQIMEIANYYLKKK